MPNDDLISKKNLLEDFEWLRSQVSECSRSEIDSYIERIKNAPAVDAELVRHARLLSTGYDEIWCEWGDCTNCGMSNIIGSKRCCKCGAHLEEER